MPYAAVNGMQLYYEEQGSGPPLVLLNGGMGALDAPGRGGWGALRPFLALRYRVVQFEHRGHRRTDNPGGVGAYTLDNLAADAASLIEHLHLAPAHVAGWSEGGAIAIRLALTRPELLRSVVGIGTNFMNDAKTRRAMELIDPDRIEREAPEWAADLARQHDEFRGSGHWRELLTWMIASEADERLFSVEDLRRIALPTLWIAGEDDIWFELDQPLAMKREIPGAELLIVNHAEHGPQQSHPHLVGPVLLDFLTRQDERRLQ